jgi:putative ABC transport system permease protein
MNLAWRDIRHNGPRFALTCLGLGLLMAVVLAMVGIYNGLVADALTIARAPKADVWVVEAGTRGPFAESSRIPGDTRQAIARLHGVADAGGITFQSVETRLRGAPRRLYVLGVEPGRPGAPTDLTAGRPLGGARFELIADRRAGLRLGETVVLGRDRYRVIGVVDGHVSSGGDPAVYVGLRDAQTLQFQLAPPAARRSAAAGGAPVSADTVNAVVARALPGADPAAIADTARRWKHLAAMTQIEQENILTLSVVDRARRQIGLFMAILLAVSAVMIALIIYTMTMEKLRQIATLKLIGAPDSVIVGMILRQALILGGVGWASGLGLMLLVKDHFPRRVALEPENALALGAIIFVVCVLASGLGVRAALRVDPADAMGG